jgi:hypothetical protein
MYHSLSAQRLSEWTLHSSNENHMNFIQICCEFNWFWHLSPNDHISIIRFKSEPRLLEHDIRLYLTHTLVHFYRNKSDLHIHIFINVRCIQKVAVHLWKVLKVTERTTVSKNWIKQLHTLAVLRFNHCLTTEYSEIAAHFNGNFDTDSQIYVP